MNKEELEAQILYYSTKYYEGNPEISDEQFDMLVDKLRELDPMSKVLKGKDIAVIDDSIVRGTTSKKIISLLRAAGARSIHLAIACPEIKFPDLYGIDTPTFEELISHNKNADEVKNFVGADTLTFLSIDELKESIGLDRQYSMVSFDGDYFIKE